MTDIKSSETQQDFFNFSKPGKGPEIPSYNPGFQKPILVTTSLEQIILAGILLILAACFVFFLGVLRGKAISGKAVEFPGVSSAVRPTAAAGVSPAAPVSIRPAVAVNNSSAAVLPQETGKPYTIQLATYKRRDWAETEAATLRRSGYVSLIVPNGDFFEVRVGQYANKEEAKKDLKFFASRYSGCYLRRR